jgi:5-methylcytosine-specific restriction endonuclease McrA
MSKVPEKNRAKVIQRAKGRCEACGIGIATDIHHRQRRREGGHEVTNLIWVDRTCHDRIHAHPEWAQQHGWIVPTWGDYAAAPLKVGGRWSLLTPEGGVEFY